MTSDDGQEVFDEFAKIMYENGMVTPPSRQGEAIARFAALSRRLRAGEITQEEFEAEMQRGQDDPA